MIAVIIPTYNNLPGLVKLVRQIGGFDTYVIEDGCKPETIEWLYSEPALNVLLHDKNKGVAPSWNEGLRWAIKDGYTHFAFFNDDIELPENWREEVENAFKKDNVHMVCLNTALFSGWFFVLDKCAVDTVGFFDEQFVPFTCEDRDYLIRYEQSGLKHKKIDLPVLHHGGTSTNQIKNEKNEYFKKVWNENWMKLRNKYPHIKFQDNLI